MRARTPARALLPEETNVADDGPATVQDMAEMVRKTTFRMTRLQPRYEEEEVDTFLDEIVATLAEGGQLDPALLHAVSFRTPGRAPATRSRMWTSCWPRSRVSPRPPRADGPAPCISGRRAG